MRKPWDCNVEIVAMDFANMADKIDAMLEATVNRGPGILPRGRVPTESEDISAAMGFCFLESEVYFLLGHIGAGEVHAGFDADQPLASANKLRG